MTKAIRQGWVEEPAILIAWKDFSRIGRHIPACQFLLAL